MSALSARDALSAAVASLSAAGSAHPAAEAEVLLAEVLGIDQIAPRLSDRLTAREARRLGEFVERRAQREPLAYVVGWVEFRALRLRVDRRVVVPCDPPTGLLVDLAVELPQGARVADVGTGSGAVALSVKHERPDLVVTGTDASGDAIEVARENAERLGLDLEFETLAGVPPGDFDLVLTNPPYARDDELPALGEELSAHQPHLALFGGTDGLGVLRSIVATAKRGTRLATEHDRSQTGGVRKLLADALTRNDPHTTSSVTVGLVA